MRETNRARNEDMRTSLVESEKVTTDKEMRGRVLQIH
jgi:hypothetical protein